MCKATSFEEFKKDLQEAIGDDVDVEKEMGRVGEAIANALKGVKKRHNQFWEYINDNKESIGRWTKDSDNEELKVFIVEDLDFDGKPSDGIVFEHGTGQRFCSIKDAKRLAKLLKRAINQLQGDE